MTGAYLRAIRNGKWDNVEVEHLTEEELKDKFLTRPPEELVNWMSMLCAKLREIEPIFNGLVEDGILQLVDKNAAVHSNSSNENQPESTF
jgi:hypothetical protein